jgi:hypothetical protein
MADYLLGGANLLQIWLQASDEATTLFLELAMTISTTVDRDANGQVTITLDNEQDNAALQTALEAALPIGVSVTAEPERTYEDGTKVGGGSAAGLPKYLAAAYGSVGDDGRKVWCGEVQFDPTSGSYKQADNTPTSPKVVIKSVLTDALKTIPIANFDSTLVTPVADVVIPDGSYGKPYFLPEA